MPLSVYFNNSLKLLEGCLPGGLWLPKGTPKDIITQIHADVTRVLQGADVTGRLTGMAASVAGTTPEQFGALIRDDSAKWAKLIKESGIKAD